MRYLVSKYEAAREKGAALPFIALLLVLLLGMAAFAIDLGWIFLNGSRVQRAADASALAGVVYLPADTNNVSNFSAFGAEANGYDIGQVNSSPFGNGGPDSLDWQPLADNKLEVTLHSQIDTFFLKIFGMDSLNLSRRATAEYIKPVAMGSPTACFGLGPDVENDGLPNGSIGRSTFNQCDDFVQNFWGAVNGRRTAKQHGDPYLVTCAHNCPGSNPEFDASNPFYYYGIEVPAGKTAIELWTYDGGFYDRNPAFDETGDEESLTNSNTGGTNMTFTLFRPDATPQIARDNSVQVACANGTGNLTINSESQSGTHENRWARMCRMTGNPVPPGIYILRVANGGANIGGNNSYAVMAAGQPFSGTVANNPRVYAIDSMSIFTNDDDGTATVYLAEIKPEHKGKSLELRFFDPGEGDGTTWMRVQNPSGNVATGCTWTLPHTPANASGCSLRTTVSNNVQYNGQWVEVSIPIPQGYNCNTSTPTGCFWTMRLELNEQHDRTTWEAHVIGNPVHLTPNAP